MPVILPGILTIALSVLLFYEAYRAFRNNKHMLSLTLIVAAGALLRLYTGADLYLHEWDERFHALVAKNLLNHPLKPTLYDDPLFQSPARIWIANHVWLEKPPIPLWACALSLKIFGLNEIAVRIPAILVSCLAIFLTYNIGAMLFDKKTGLLAAFLHAINGLLIEVAGGRVSSDMVETFFCFFVELALFAVVCTIHKGRIGLLGLLVGFFTALALLSKWTPGLLVFPVWLAGAWLSKRFSAKTLIIQIAGSLMVCLMVYGSWILYIRNAFPEEAAHVLNKFARAFAKPIEGHSAPWYHYLNSIRIIYGELIYLPLVASIYLLTKRQHIWQLGLITAWWLLPLLVFSLGATKRQTYMLIAAPAFFLVTAYTWFLIKDAAFVRQKYLKIIVQVLLLALPVRYAIERIKPFDPVERNPLWAQQLRSLNQKMPLDKKTVLFNAAHPIETMFYNECIAYGHLPDATTINRMRSSGYRIIIIENGPHVIYEKYGPAVLMTRL